MRGLAFQFTMWVIQGIYLFRNLYCVTSQYKLKMASFAYILQSLSMKRQNIMTKRCEVQKQKSRVSNPKHPGFWASTRRPGSSCKLNVDLIDKALELLS